MTDRPMPLTEQLTRDALGHLKDLAETASAAHRPHDGRDGGDFAHASASFDRVRAWVAWDSDNAAAFVAVTQAFVEAGAQAVEEEIPGEFVDKVMTRLVERYGVSS